MKKRIGILILDSHPDVCRALEARLDSSGRIRVVATGHSLEKGLELAGEHEPRVVLLDARLIDTPTALRTFVGSLPPSTSGIIVLTTFADELEREHFVTSGAHRYLLKDIDSARLIGEIETVAAGQDLGAGSNPPAD